MARTITMYDRYGQETSAEASLEGFMELYDSVARVGRDEDWRDVFMTDSDEWNLNVNPDAITFENVEEGGEFESSQAPDRETVRVLADLFLRGDLDAIRERLSPA